MLFGGFWGNKNLSKSIKPRVFRVPRHLQVGDFVIRQAPWRFLQVADCLEKVFNALNQKANLANPVPAGKDFKGRPVCWQAYVWKTLRKDPCWVRLCWYQKPTGRSNILYVQYMFFLWTSCFTYSRHKSILFPKFLP